MYNVDELVLRRSSSLDDWYYLHVDSRKRGAIPEGTAKEWEAISSAILDDCDESFKRVAVRKINRYSWVIFSPRNAYGKADYIFFSEKTAKVFANRILHVINDVETTYDTLGNERGS